MESSFSRHRRINQRSKKMEITHNKKKLNAHFYLICLIINAAIIPFSTSLFASENSITNESHESFEYYHQTPPASENAKSPTVPTLLSPAPLSEVSGTPIELKWSKVSEASAYALQISSDPIFFQLLVNEPLYKETSYTLKDMKLESGKNYYWRVAAVREENQAGTIKSLFNRSSFTTK